MRLWPRHKAGRPETDRHETDPHTAEQHTADAPEAGRPAPGRTTKGSPRSLPATIVMTLSVALAVTLTAALTGAFAPARPSLRSEKAAPAAPHSPQWTATWGAAMQQATNEATEDTPNWSRQGFKNETLRQVIRLSVGGPELRIRLSNAYGTKPLHIAGATVARSDGEAKARPGTVRTLTFRHAPALTIPAGRDTVSDAVAMPTANLEKLTVTLRFTAPTGPATMHRFTTATSYRAPGDRLRSPAADDFNRRASHAWYYLTAVDVTQEPPRSADSLMVFGDSLMDGVGTSPDTDNRFSDKLAERLIAAGRPQGMTNAGLAGDPLLHDSPCFGEKGTARFAKELRDRAALRTVFIHLGANDLAQSQQDDPCTRNRPPVTAQQLIDGHRALVRAAHARGIKAIGVTILPLRSAVFPFTTPAGDKIRRQLNHWIRTSHTYDAVLDADRVLTDPANPNRPRPGYISQDGLHPSDAGYLALASAVDLNAL
ncbi:SGNH/GDSL hydrolase family protein [Streptomyces inhibens]|uniref:SGNH/GDSL hydrolase family protein n=1 Tax=Streptomyces inhibens TaxID=2293571 RepID=UPI00017623F5|nr:SGNH/GDSL hydrolase family protein [Streptomyces inhibens]UKY51804.1 SGNH/GDSL hydrolase family protein [Streptomyces inhibens]